MRYHDFTLYCQAVQREQIWQIYRKFPIYMPFRSDLAKETVSVSIVVFIPFTILRLKWLVFRKVCFILRNFEKRFELRFF